MEKATSTLFARILTSLGVVAVLVSSYWFLTTSLTPYPVPAAPPKRTGISFNPQVDVSKDVTFNQLRPLSDLKVEVGETGRANPFLPPLPAATIPTSTPVTTSTLPLAPVSVTSTENP